MQFSAKNLPRYIRRNGDGFMYQIQFRGSRLQHKYDTWEEACEGRDEFVHSLIMKYPEEKEKLKQYIGNKEGMKRTKRTRASSEEPKKNKKVAESPDSKKVLVNEIMSKVTPQKKSPEQPVKNGEMQKVVQLPAAPVAKEVPPVNVLPVPTLKHNLPPLNKKELPPISKVDIKEVIPAVAKEVLPVNPQADSITTHLPVLFNGQKTEIGIRVIDIHKLKEPGKENCVIYITVNDSSSFPLKVFEFNQLYKPLL